MLLSKEKRFLFIHIQKTAGTSITKILRDRVPDIESYLKPHSPLSLADGDCKIYYKAAFVRNPFDRLVSWYAMIDKNRKLSSFQIEQMDNKFQREVLQKSTNFTEFILNCEYITDKSGWMPLHNNQVDYLNDENGSIAVDFIGRFENLADDMAKLGKELGLSNVKLLHINKSKHYDYQNYYTEETKQIVSKRFERDLEYFKYKF